MSWTSIFKIFSAAARSGGAKAGAQLGEVIGAGMKGFSSWISSWKLGNVLKIGGTGGIVAVVYSTWRSGVSAIADATGLSEDTTATLIGLTVAGLILYVIVRLILPPKDRIRYDDRLGYDDGRYGYDDWQWRGQR